MIERASDSEKLSHVFHGFLEPNRRLFAHYHQPSGAGRRTAYVLCPPIGYEGVHCHHTFKVLAGKLAASGIPAMRIHYHGTGESAGSDEDPDRVDAWLSSVETAMDALLDMQGVDRVGLIGLRLGATLAAAAARRRTVSDLVLWEPCESGAMYVREMQILASATARQLEAEAGALPDVPGVPDGLQAGGYLLTPDTVESLSALSLYGQQAAGRTRTLVVQRDDRPANGSLVAKLGDAGFDASAEQMPGHREMMAGAHPMSSVVPSEIVARIVAWAVDGSEAAGHAAGMIPKLAREMLTDGLRRRIVRFGPDDRMFGIVTEPEDGAAPGRADVVMFSGGVVPRTAVNRAYVGLAARLAGGGHRVLRFDVSGIGESEPAPGNSSNEIFPTSLLPDAGSALDFMAGQNAAAHFWLIGLCSGAATTFQTAVADERVRGAVMINTAAFYWEPGSEPASMNVKQFAESKRYGQSLRNASSWTKLLSGKVNVVRIGALLWSRVRSSIATRWACSGLFGLKRAEGLVPDLLRLRRRGVSVNLAFSPADYSYELLKGLAGAGLGKLDNEGVVIKRFPGADHTFNPLGVRMQLIDWIHGLVLETGSVDRSTEHRVVPSGRIGNSDPAATVTAR